ncbi:MAG: hypothetical protein HXS40_04385, partial [Theionarchaea archaeon]|nr:hypothetical protein [Theionarchaea archaeon]
MALLNESQEVELMIKMLDFARRHGRKITEDQARKLGGGSAQSLVFKLLAQEYLLRVEKQDIPPFYSITSRGLNLFGDMRKSQPVPENLRAD